MLRALTHHAKHIVAGVFCTLLCCTAQALPEDRNQPIVLEADRAERNEKSNMMIYEGNVELRQGSLLITADSLEIKSLDGKVSFIEAKGSPAYLNQVPAIDKPPIKAWARTIVYRVDTEVLQLQTEARVEQDGAIVESDIIDYFIKQELVKASGSTKNDGNSRVRVTIPPQTRTEAPTSGNP
ncbi:MAG: lipopolysaccharide transport periplasmic protein LptA [Pseudomonadales bacterium]